MPTYEYVCTDCGHEFDAVQGFSDAALTECPDCHTGRLRKRFGSVGVVFKGSGFYRTDSRSDRKSAGGAAAPKKDKGTGDSTSSSSSGGSSSGTSESAPSKTSATAKGSSSTS